MDFKDFNIGNDDITRRVDKVIRIFAANLTLPEIYKAIRKGLIKVNSKKTKEDYRIKEGDVINIASFLLDKANDIKVKKNTYTNNSQIMPKIVFENEHLLIIDKPYNVNVHGDKNSLDKIILNYLENNYCESSLSFKPGPLHRLDRNTTGLLAFSKSLKGAHWFSEKIQTHIIQKKYYGLVNGKLEKEEEWHDIIKNDDNDINGFHTVLIKPLIGSIINEKDKLAITIAKPLAYGKLINNEVTLVEFTIETGRKHQIRAQSTFHHHGLIGDSAYGNQKLDKKYQEFYLTAKELIFPKDNPLGLPEKLEVELPTSFKQILKDCGIDKSVV